MTDAGARAREAHEAGVAASSYELDRLLPASKVGPRGYALAERVIRAYLAHMASAGFKLVQVEPLVRYWVAMDHKGNILAADCDKQGADAIVWDWWSHPDHYEGADVPADLVDAYPQGPYSAGAKIVECDVIPATPPLPPEEGR